MKIVQINTHEVVSIVYYAYSRQNSELISVSIAPCNILLSLGSSKVKTELKKPV